MKKIFIILTILSLVILGGCGAGVPESTTVPTTTETETVPDTTAEETVPETTEAETVPETTEAETVPETTEAETVPETTEAETVPETTAESTIPEHSPLYIPGVSVEDVILYFNEVSLDAEFTDSGNPSLLQKWTSPIQYTLNGTYTEEDYAVLTAFTQWLNTLEGFPGISETQDIGAANLNIYFRDYPSFLNLMGDNYAGCDGGVTFWYNGNNEIYQATIGYVTEIDQQVRNSVILEEIYNGLGPVQDTNLRQDSLIYSGYSIPQELTEIDELLLKLLYHPDMKCGMNAGECEAVIRNLYY